ncbi:nitroreductase family protein [Caldicellulosiruptoraceae bacterium PP1]
MDTINILKQRKSIRKYKPNQKIDKKDLELIIDAARYAPTANNTQGWAFVVVTDENLRKQMAEYARWGRFIKDASACVAVLYKKDSQYIIEDGSAASAYICVAAKALNLGTCWVASYKKEHSEKVKDLLNVPDNYELFSLIAIGVPDEDPSREKKPLNEILHWEKF